LEPDGALAATATRQERMMTSAGPAAAPDSGAIYVTASDKNQLLMLLEARRMEGREDIGTLAALEEELDRAVVVDGPEVPTDVVTLGSRVRLADLDSGEEMIFTVVLPSRANADQGRISVLAPLGMAVLGYRAGARIEWDVPGGRRRLRVQHVIQQPPAARRLRSPVVTAGVE
jgi:regulator of nucleoside diphosphate kinase